MIWVLVIFYLVGVVGTVLSLKLISGIEDLGSAVFALLIAIFWPVILVVLIPFIVAAHLIARRGLG